MSNESITARLRNLELFRGLSAGQIEAVAGCGERMVFRPGQVLVAAGATGDGALVVFSGEVELAGDGAVEPRPVEAGSLIGEMAMLIEHEHRVTVTARGTVRALKIPRTALHAQMLRDPTLAGHFADRIASRLTRMAVELRRIDQMLALAAEPAASG